MTQHFLRTLLDEASRPFRSGGRFAYHYARGKLSSDSIFREILRRGLFPAEGRYLDLGCGQGDSSLLLARQHEDAIVLGVDQLAVVKTTVEAATEPSVGSVLDRSIETLVCG